MFVLWVKAVHVLSAAVFFGGGLLSAWYKVCGDSQDLKVVVFCQRQVVKGDFLFTIPSGLVSPLTGAYLVFAYQLPWTTPWVLWGVAGYVTAGALWVPAAFLQARMRRLAERSLCDNTPLPPAFHRANRVWFWLGVPSFAAALFTVWVMVAKHAW